VANSARNLHVAANANKKERQKCFKWEELLTSNMETSKNREIKK
jgi:hypothetical protein